MTLAPVHRAALALPALLVLLALTLGLAPRGGARLLLAEGSLLTLLLPLFGARYVRARGLLARLERSARHPMLPELRRAAWLLGATALGLLLAVLIPVLAGRSELGPALLARLSYLTWAVFCVAAGLAFGRALPAAALCAFIAAALFTAAPLLAALPSAAWAGTLVTSFNPLGAAFDAAGRDLLRTEPFYRYSPVGFYPGTRVGWPSAAAANMLAAAAVYAVYRRRLSSP